MPKQKTHKGAKARLGVTGTGKIMRRRTHINNFRRKHRRSKSQFDEMFELHPSMRKKMRRLLPGT
jgi:large subunit ribosomal protein L35